MNYPRHRTALHVAAWAVGVLSTAELTAQVLPPAQLKGLSLQELLDTQVVSMSRSLEDWQTAPTAISLLTGSEIARAGAARLAEALRVAPGLNVARYIGGSYSISARGFGTASVNKMQVMLDGRSLYTPLFSGVFWEVQDTVIADLERIEVVRGPGATLWGANAMNGVINLVTKDARDTQGTYLSGGGGTDEKAFATVRHGGRSGEHTWYRVYAKYALRDDQILANGQPAHDGMRQSQVGFRIDHGERTGDQTTLQGDAYWVNFENPGRADSRHRGGNLLARWNHRRPSGTEFTLQAYIDHAERDVPQQFRETRDTVDLDTQWHLHPVGSHDIVAGLGGRVSWDRTSTESDRTFVFVPARRRLDLFSGFVQDSISLDPNRWTLHVGSKFEHNDYTGFEVQPSLRLAFAPDERQTWWAAVSRAVRSPTRVDTDSRFRPVPATGFSLIEGNPEFESETVLAAELGYRVQPRPGLFVDVATFHNTYDDLRTLEPTLPTGLPLVIGNGREGTTYGAELILTMQPTPRWRLRANVNYVHVDLRLQPGSLDTTGGSLEANDPKYTGSLQSTLDLPRGWQWDFFLRGASARPNPALPGYTALDMRLAWQWRVGAELALIGQNLLGPSHPEFPGGGAAQPEVERAVFARLTLRY